MTTNSTAILDETAVRSIVQKQQTAFQKARGSDALAVMVAGAYVAIRNIIQNASPETQAAILDEHAVVAAAEGTSVFTPWIKVYWGEPHFDKKKTFKDLQGNTRVIWVPDRSMEIYHHTMEELQARGVETTDVQAIAATIMASNGASQMAKARKARLATEARNAANPVTENTRKLFLDETRGARIEVEIERPADHGDYMTLLVRALKDGPFYEVLAIADPNAIKTLDRVADTQAPLLKAQRAERETEKQRAVREQQIRDEERERVIGGLDGPARKALMEKLARMQPPKPAASQSKTGKVA